MHISPLTSYLKAHQGQYLRPETLALLKPIEKEYTELKTLEETYAQNRATVKKRSKEILATSDALSMALAEAAMEEATRNKLLLPLAKQQRKDLFKNKIYPLIRPILDKAIVVAESASLQDPESIAFYQSLKKRVIELQSGKVIASPQYWLYGLVELS